ncbi:MAG TPA: hypothetical protein VMV95_04005 [Bacillota bacterium]|nr:hypothetical protein [Bacillota bacterium]
MAKIHRYAKQVPGFEARILDADDSEFYKEVLAKAKKDFPNAYTFISNNIDAENATGSNFFFVCLADEMLGKTKRIPTYKDWADMLNGGNFAKGVYFDANQLVLRSNQASYKRNQHLINDLVRKLKGQYEFSPKNPLIITNPKLRKSKAGNNDYKLILNLEDATFENNSDFAYGKNKIELGNHTKNLLAKEKGLSRLCLGQYFVDSYCDNLAYSNSNSRVAFLDAEGVAHVALQI